MRSQPPLIEAPCNGLLQGVAVSRLARDTLPVSFERRCMRVADYSYLCSPLQ